MEADFYVQWHITDLCNLRCRHCYQDRFTGGEDLDWPELKGVADNLLGAFGEWGRRACIHLTGGEPLLKPTLWPLLEHLSLRAEVEELGIITNGLLLDGGTLERLSALPKFRKVKISLDGADAGVNDLIRPAGTFDRVVESILRARECGAFEVQLMFTVMKSNLENLPAFIRLCEDLRVQGMIIERFIPWGRGREIREEVLDGEEWRRMVRALFEHFAVTLEEGEIPPFQAFQVDLRGREPELLGAPCVLGTEGFCVMPRGEVYPCRRFPLSVGNLRQESLKDIWEKSEVLNRLRDRNNLKGKCGKCRQEGCTGCRSLAFCLTGDFLAEDPHCWQTC
jgi:radical SAM protein with 4Fe4S-binding SPASM domain